MSKTLGVTYYKNCLKRWVLIPIFYTIKLLLIILCSNLSQFRTEYQKFKELNNDDDDNVNDKYIYNIYSFKSTNEFERS